MYVDLSLVLESGDFAGTSRPHQPGPAVAAQLRLRHSGHITFADLKARSCPHHRDRRSLRDESRRSARQSAAEGAGAAEFLPRGPSGIPVRRYFLSSASSAAGNGFRTSAATRSRGSDAALTTPRGFADPARACAAGGRGAASRNGYDTCTRWVDVCGSTRLAGPPLTAFPSAGGVAPLPRAVRGGTAQIQAATLLAVVEFRERPPTASAAWVRQCHAWVEARR